MRDLKDGSVYTTKLESLGYEEALHRGGVFVVLAGGLLAKKSTSIEDGLKEKVHIVLKPTSDVYGY